MVEMDDVLARACQAVKEGAAASRPPRVHQHVAPTGKGYKPKRHSQASKERLVSRSFEGTNLRSAFALADVARPRPPQAPNRHEAKKLLRLVEDGAGTETVRGNAPRSWTDDGIFSAVLAEHGAAAIEAKYEKNVTQAPSSRPGSAAPKRAFKTNSAPSALATKENAVNRESDLSSSSPRSTRSQAAPALQVPDPFQQMQILPSSAVSPSSTAPNLSAFDEPNTDSFGDNNNWAATAAEDNEDGIPRAPGTESLQCFDPTAVVDQYNIGNALLSCSDSVETFDKTIPATDPFPIPSFAKKARKLKEALAVTVNDPEAVDVWVPDRYGLNGGPKPRQPILQHEPMRGLNQLQDDESPYEWQIAQELQQIRDPLSPYRAPSVADVIPAFPLYAKRQEASLLRSPRPPVVLGGGGGGGGGEGTAPSRPACLRPSTAGNLGKAGKVVDPAAVRAQSAIARWNRIQGGDIEASIDADSADGVMGHFASMEPQSELSTCSPRQWDGGDMPTSANIKVSSGKKSVQDTHGYNILGVIPAANPVRLTEFKEASTLLPAPHTPVMLAKAKKGTSKNIVRPPWRPSSANATVHRASAPSAGVPAKVKPSPKQSEAAPAPTLITSPEKMSGRERMSIRAKSAPSQRLSITSTTQEGQLVGNKGAAGRFQTDILARLSKRKIAHRQKDNRDGIVGPVIGSNEPVAAHMDPEGQAICIKTPPVLPVLANGDWCESELLLDALDGDDDLVPLELTLLFKAAADSNPSKVQQNFFDSFALLEKFHADLSCPQHLHEAFWAAHCVISPGNVVSTILRLSALNTARNVLMALLRSLFGRPAPMDTELGLQPGAPDKAKRPASAGATSQPSAAPAPTAASDTVNGAQSNSPAPPTNPRTSSVSSANPSRIIAAKDASAQLIRADARRALDLMRRSSREQETQDPEYTSKFVDDVHMGTREKMTTFAFVVEEALHGSSSTPSTPPAAGVISTSVSVGKPRESMMSLGRKTRLSMGASTLPKDPYDLLPAMVSIYGLLKKMISLFPWKIHTFIFHGVDYIARYNEIKDILEELKIAAIEKNRRT